MQESDATTITLSTTGGDVDIVTFIHYNGGGTGTAGNYRRYKSGDFRFGSIGF